MSKILVFESTCCNAAPLGETGERNLVHVQGNSLGELRHEGWTMLQAIVEDLSNAGHHVWTTLSKDIEPDEIKGQVFRVDNNRELLEQLGELAIRADHILIIAPELANQLLDWMHWFSPLGDKIVGCKHELVETLSSKHETCCWLAERGLPVPSGQRMTSEQLIDYLSCTLSTSSQIIKPDDGAGGIDIIKISDRPHLSGDRSTLWRVETFVAGTAVSVLIICGPGGHCFLPPCGQYLSNGNYGAYVGGYYPIPGKLIRRAQTLAERVISVLPLARGFVGIDMVLGADDRCDYVIECNPRLTSSYLLLRQRAQFNLAETLLRVVKGAPFGGRFSEEPATLSIRPEPYTSSVL